MSSFSSDEASSLDDAIRVISGDSSVSTPNLILDDLLEPTPFQEGTSLQLTSEAEIAGFAPSKPTMVYKPSPSANILSSMTKNDEILKRSDLLSLMEKTLKSETSKTSKRSLPAPQSADVDAFNFPRPNKRQRPVSDDDSVNSNLGPRLRPHQDVLWREHFNALVQFKNKYGHCHVHYTCGHDQSLSKWVQRQRYQYKLKSSGKKSTMTEERQQKLEAVGFIWDSHAATWQQRLAELAQYKREHGDCKVPSTFPPNPQLAMWVKSQRRQYKLYRSGLSSNLSEERLAALNDLGFTWELRSVNEPPTTPFGDVKSNGAIFDSCLVQSL